MHGYKSSWSTQWLQSDLTLTTHRLLNIDLQQTKSDVDCKISFFSADMVCSKLAVGKVFSTCPSIDMGNSIPMDEF